MGTLLYFDKTKSTVDNASVRLTADEITQMADNGQLDGLIVGGIKDGKIVCESTVGANKYLIWTFAERLLARIGKL